MKIALFTCVLFSALLIFYGVWISPPESFMGGDWSKHLDKSNGLEEHNNWLGIQHYPPLFHWLAKPYNFTNRTFYVLGCLIFGLLVPFTLAWIAKSESLPFFYFTSTTIYTTLEFGGYVPLALMFFVFLLFIKFMEWKYRIPLLFLSLLVHSFGFWLLVSYWVLEGLFQAEWKNIFPIGALTGCDKPPAVFEEPVARSLPKPYNFVGEIRLGLIVSYLIRGFPLPFMAVAVYKLWKEGKKHLIAMSGFAMFAGFINDRALLVSSLLLLVGLARYYDHAPKKTRIAMFVFAILLLLFNLNHWILLKAEMVKPLC